MAAPGADRGSPEEGGVLLKDGAAVRLSRAFSSPERSGSLSKWCL